MTLEEDIIIDLYKEHKRKALLKFERGAYAEAMHYWQVAAYSSYTFYFNEIDNEIEEGLLSFSSLIKRNNCHNKSISFSKKRCVFYDSHGNDKGALTQQYIRAIFESGWEMLYIVEKERPDAMFLPILAELKRHEDKVKIQYLPKGIKGLKRVQLIFDSVVNWGGENLFMHLYPWSCYAVAAFNALPASIVRYHINHSDHAFWVGRSCIDYNFEFREYGCNLSVNKRGIKKEQLLLLPFYPIESNAPFEGLPFDMNGKIIIFSGGSYYKTFGNDDTYFKICKALLDIDERVVIIYAGLGDGDEFQKRLRANCIDERFYLLGRRNDISAIFEHSDFYLNTYPISGGLMCTYAAIHCVPIIAYGLQHASTVEDFICQIGKVDITSNSIEALCTKVRELISNKIKRIEYAKVIKACVVDSELFNKAFLESVCTKRTQFPFLIDSNFQMYDYDRKSKLDYINRTKEYQTMLLGFLGVKECLLNYTKMCIEGIVKLLKNRYKRKFKQK